MDNYQKQYGKEKMDSVHIDEAMDEFHECAQQSKTALEKMLSVISGGRVPSRTEHQEFDRMIESLRGKYEIICSAAKRELMEDELPEQGSSVQDYCEAVRNSRKAFANQLNEIRTVLQKYLSVQSLASKPALALEPFQKDAEDLLGKINGDEITSLEDIKEEAAGPHLFLAALECEDLDTDVGSDMLDFLEERFRYPSRVTRGLLSKKYHIPKDAVPEEKTAAKEPVPEAKEPDPEPVPEAKEEDFDGKREDSAFVKELKKADFALEEKQFGILSSDISPAESKEISASIFLSDLKKGNVEAEKRIIKQIDHFPLLSHDVLMIHCQMKQDTAELSLDFLHKKGYLRKYSVTPGGEFYCPTLRLENALTFKKASNFAGVRQYRPEDMGELIEDRVSAASARAAFLKVYIYNAQNYRERKITKYVTDRNLYKEAFLCRSYSGNESDGCRIFAGGFWTEYSECDDFFEELKMLLRDNRKINRFVFASFDVDSAKKLAKAFLAIEHENLKEEDVWLYALAEDRFYEYDGKKEIIFGEAASASGEKKDEEESVVYEAEISGSLEEAKGMESSSSDEAQTNICRFFADRRYYCASAYAKALSNRDASYGSIYDLIAYAVHDPMKHCTYSADSVFDMASNVNGYFSESLMAAIGMRTCFSNQVSFDYNIQAFYDVIRSYPVFEQFPALVRVLYQLVEFKDKHKKGMDAYADYHAKSTARLKEELRKVQQEANSYYENTILGKKIETAKIKRFIETKKILFAPDGEIGQFIKTVADDDREMQPLLTAFLQEKFIKEGNRLAEDTMDSNMQWDYIMDYWEQARDKVRHKIREDLTGQLKSNIVKATDKALQIMIRWCVLVDQTGSQAEDDGSAAYKKIRKPLLNDIQEAMHAIEENLSSEMTDLEKKAGMEAIRYSLDELGRCIEGTYEENEKKFFYAPFLFTDDILLDENFYPELDVKSADVRRLQPEYRIMGHSRKNAIKPIARLDEILEDGGDDYGSARRIVEYLRFQSPDKVWDGYSQHIDSGEKYARETAKLKKMQFVGDLELAYVCGQIDNANSAENKKEKILQIVDAWYEWACDSSNYGFFAKVMDGYLEEIRRESKSREQDLLAQLDVFKAAATDLGIEVKEKRIAKIQAAIKNQNYTVAEDLLAHAFQPYDEHEDIVEEHFLKDFLEDYKDYYQPVSQGKQNFASLVSKNQIRNKEEKGGQRLAENWLPGGSNLGKHRLVKLLAGFGFHVNNDSVQPYSFAEKYEQFTVKTIPAQAGKRENYTHPVVAFGSGAAQDGFRVVCLNGKYDAADIIDVMKQIGNAKHTMILLDCALDKPERRILARKSKSELGDKLCVVVDRTVMMYMVKNYDEKKAARMLLSLIVPFGYYQPYVWDSANKMPPEIFMGRKHELESIESPTGANIVYGGRQLGKSALLKKAKEDIDKDENGNIAVLVDIKNLGCRDAARAIGKALHDEGVLAEDPDTTEWDELSRRIKNRLRSDKDRIPYLLLLLDESDAFIESCEKIKYKPFDALKDIQSFEAGRFKFVIAGLHNLVRFKRDAALGNNSVLPHLGSITVKPFQITEARELIEIPLHYMGLVFPKENEWLITLILATTNYFPGLIQMYCAKLLSAMRNNDYAGYREADTPIYEMSVDHIKKVLVDPEFQDKIKEKFLITLKLDEDNYYYLIALIMAYVCHEKGYNDGYSVQDIKDAGMDLGIKEITNLGSDKLSALMEELKELNVLRSTDNSHYLFTRYSFFQMMGTISEVEDKLMEYMEG